MQSVCVMGTQFWLGRAGDRGSKQSVECATTRRFGVLDHAVLGDQVLVPQPLPNHALGDVHHLVNGVGLTVVMPARELRDVAVQVLGARYGVFADEAMQGQLVCGIHGLRHDYVGRPILHAKQQPSCRTLRVP